MARETACERFYAMARTMSETMKTRTVGGDDGADVAAAKTLRAGGVEDKGRRAQYIHRKG